MADFVHLWRRRHEAVSQLMELARQADEARPVETRAGVNIQRYFRGYRDRKVLRGKRFAAITIQRVFRGHLGRDRVAALQAIRQEEQETSLFHYYCTVIQRAFRGYYSRRYYHDFFARKAYIDSIKKKSEELRNALSGHMEQQLERMRDAEEERAKQELQKVAQNLHHLVSTTAQPGIYNPPFAQDQLPTVFDIPVEMHLRGAVKDLLRSRRLRQQATAPPSYAGEVRSTLRTDTEYGVADKLERDEKRYSKMRHLSQQPFMAGTRPRPPPHALGVNAASTFEESWRAARSTKELAELPADKPKRVSSKPFVGTVPKGQVFEDYERARSRQGRMTGSVSASASGNVSTTLGGPKLR